MDKSLSGAACTCPTYIPAGQVIVSHECALSANFGGVTFPTFDTANPRGDSARPRRRLRAAAYIILDLVSR